MSIPIATTTIQLLEPTAFDPENNDDWGTAPDPETGYEPAGEPVRAHLSAPSGNATFEQSGFSSSLIYRLLCDPCGIEPSMLVQDLGSGITYTVSWCLSRPGPMPHVVAGLNLVSDTA